jgi:nitrogen PTS system EIIA component
MELVDLIEPRDVLVDCAVASKAELLRILAGLASERTGVDSNAILGLLVNRERLGSTGMGNGVAIPHANAPELMTPLVLLVRLTHPIDFEAIDDMPVDIVFMALSPALRGASHLNILACIARSARSESWLKAVRQAPSSAALHKLLAGTTN